MATTRICSIPDCGKPMIARGWCYVHWGRWRKHGDPLVVLGTPRGAAKDFYERLFSSATNDCIIWPYARDACGYGEMGTPDGKRDVHPLVCARVHGPRPSPNHDARHLCGNGHLGCVNPRHLAWGTKKQNAADSLRHGTRQRGEEKHGAHFTNEQVREIRRRIAAKQEAIKTIAASFGVDPRRITEIKKGRKYASVR